MKQLLIFILSKKKLQNLISVAILLFFSFTLNAQSTIQTTAGSVAACPGDLITVPVNVANCNNVGSISLKLGYDPTVLVYQGYQNPHPALASGFLVAGSSGNQVALSWFSPFQSVSVGTDVLIEYQFTYLGGSCPLEWDTITSGNCQYSDLNGSIYPDIYVDGIVSLLSPPVTVSSQPQNVTITNNSNTSFSITAVNAASYQWQESADGGMTWSDIVNGGVYSGSTTATLTLTNVPLSMDGYKYRCVVSGLCPPGATSLSATLNVTSPLPTIITTIDSFQACTGDTIIIPVNVENFTDVVILSHKINYDTIVLTYINHQNVNPALTGFFLTNASGGNFSVSWLVPSTPATIPDGILYEIVFVYNGGDCNLHWDLSYPDNNFYNHISNIQFPAIWNNGYIESAGGPAAIISQPHDIITNINSTAIFSVIATGALTYQWEESTDAGLTWSALYDGGVYSGTSTSVLTIAGVLANMDQNYYRCVVNGLCNDFDISDMVILTVIPQTTIITQAVSVSACAGSTINVPIRVTELNGVYKLRLELYYSIAWADYNGFANPLPELTSGTLFSITEPNPGIIVIESESYYLYNGAFGDTTLVELIFTPLSTSVPLIWGQANSWYQDSLSNPIPAWFVDGVITSNSLPTADAGQDATICSGHCTILSANGGVSYLWDNGQTTASITVCPAITTTYTVTVTDASGCTDSDDVMVTVIDLPIADAGPDQTIITGTSTILDGTVMGGSGYYDYNWEPAALLVDATVEDPITLLLSASANFIFTVTDQVTGCVSIADTVHIVVLGPGYLSVDPTATPDTICNGNISSLQANPGGGSGTYTFVWSSNPPGFTSTLENPTVSATISTWYIVTVYDGFTTFTDSVLVTVIPPPLADAGPDVTICEDATYMLPGTASGQSSLLWTTSGDGTFNDNTILNPVYTPGINDIANGSVILTLTATATPPCTSIALSDMILTISPSPVVNLGNDTTLCKNDTLTLYAGNPGCTYLWNTGETTASINVSSAVDTIMIYSVIVTNLHGCSTDASIEVTFVTCSSLDQMDKIPKISIFPNPNDGKFQFQISNFKSDLEMFIMNIHGQLIRKEILTVNTSPYIKEIDLSMMPKGFYFIRVRSNEMVKIEKVVVR